MVSLDNLVVTTALPVIRRQLDASVVAARVDGQRVHAHVRRAAPDRRGARRPLRAAAALRARARHLHARLGRSRRSRRARRCSTPRARSQGVGGAIVVPLTLTILSAGVPAERRGLALGIWGGISGLAVAFGPLVGGAVVSGISWHWIFWLNVPIGLVLAPLAWRRLDETHGADGGLDLPGSALASAGLLGIVWGLVRGNEHGWRLGRDRRSDRRRRAPARGRSSPGSCARPAPMLPMRFFRNRTFALANVASLLMCFGMFGSIFLLAQFFQTVQDFSPLQSGLRILPWTAMPMIVAPIAGALSDRIGGDRLMTRGSRAAGRRAALDRGRDRRRRRRTPTSSAPFTLSGIGMGLFFAPVANVVLGAVRPEEQGKASGANNAIRELGGVFGVAVLASLFARSAATAAPATFVHGTTIAVYAGGAVVAARGRSRGADPARPRGPARAGRRAGAGRRRVAPAVPRGHGRYQVPDVSSAGRSDAVATMAGVVGVTRPAAASSRSGCSCSAPGRRSSACSRRHGGGPLRRRCRPRPGRARASAHADRRGDRLDRGRAGDRAARAAPSVDGAARPRHRPAGRASPRAIAARLGLRASRRARDGARRRLEAPPARAVRCGRRSAAALARLPLARRGGRRRRRARLPVRDRGARPAAASEASRSPSTAARPHGDRGARRAARAASTASSRSSSAAGRSRSAASCSDGELSAAHRHRPASTAPVARVRRRARPPSGRPPSHRRRPRRRRADAASPSPRSASRTGPVSAQVLLRRGGPLLAEALAARRRRPRRGARARVAPASTSTTSRSRAALGEPVDRGRCCGPPRARRRRGRPVPRRAARRARSVARRRRGRSGRGVACVRVYREPGHVFRALRRASDRAGAVLAVGASREEAAAPPHDGGARRARRGSTGRDQPAGALA